MQGTVLSQVIRHELRLLARDPAPWLMAAIFAALALFAIASGLDYADKRAETATQLRIDENSRREALQTQLGKIEAGTLPPPDKPWRDPRNPLSVGNNAAATAVITDAPLLFMATGISDLYPAAFRIGIGSADTFLFSDEIANPLHLATGPFDLAFVLTAILPLFVIALCYNVVSGEREQGTLSLIRAAPVSTQGILLCKLIVRASIPTLLAVAIASGSIIAACHGIVPETLITLAIAIVLYAFFWVFLIAWLSRLGKDSAFNALAALSAWLLFLLVIPALINAATQMQIPLPPRAELVLAARAATIESDRERTAESGRYREEHAEKPIAFSREQGLRRLQANMAANSRVDKILARHDAAIDRQQDFSRHWSILSPALLFQETLADLAGTSPRHMRQQIDSIRAFHRQWRTFFIAYAQTDTPLKVADYKAFPHYQPVSPHLSTGVIDIAAPMARLLGMVLALLLPGCFACYRRPFLR